MKEQEQEIRFNLEQCGYYATLKCPVCGHDNVAPTKVNVMGGIGNLKGIGTRIDAAGTAVYATPHAERGVQIALYFTCECRHVFVYSFLFHKGQSQVEQRIFPFFEDAAVIWRD